MNTIADLVKLVDETITAFPRVWSRSDDGVSAQLHEEDHLKPEPGNNKIVSYPSNTFRQVWLGLCPRLDRQASNSMRQLRLPLLLRLRPEQQEQATTCCCYAVPALLRHLCGITTPVQG